MYSKDLLVGSTGFVGTNLMQSHRFAYRCHRPDVQLMYGLNPDLCVYSGIPAEMYLANTNPFKDLEIMKNAMENIRAIKPQKLVLISSIAVYADSRGKDEISTMDTDDLSSYGKNRLLLEQWVREEYPSALIVRLPALYGKGLKKNFLYDLHSIIPKLLTEQKYKELLCKESKIKDWYVQREDGFFCCNRQDGEIRDFFENNSFNAISFTDSRSVFQFYNLSRLWSDINIALRNELYMVNLTPPPISAKEVYRFVTEKDDWKNELSKEPYNYDLRSCYASLFGGNDGYMCTVEEELADIKKFMTEWK